MFNNSYGQLLLGFFVCNFIDFTYIFNLMFYRELGTSDKGIIQSIIKYISLHKVNL